MRLNVEHPLPRIQLIVNSILNTIWLFQTCINLCCPFGYGEFNDGNCHKNPSFDKSTYENIIVWNQQSERYFVFIMALTLLLAGTIRAFCAKMY